jgi:protein tyrosine phosphatase (PTP) superfamily phosphohydrolase (DUF442 family)
MRRFTLFLFSLVVLIPEITLAQNDCITDSVVKIDQFEDLYRFENIFIGPQPSKSMISWLESERVTRIINLRTAKENKQYALSNFDEKDFVDSIGIDYVSIPVGGTKREHRYDKLSKVSKILNSGDKVLMHCKSGARARYFLAEYLVREKNCPEESAKQIAKKMGYYFPLDLLLKNEVKMDSDSLELTNSEKD